MTVNPPKASSFVAHPKEEETKTSSRSLHEDLEARKARVAELEAQYKEAKEAFDSMDRVMALNAKEGKIRLFDLYYSP